MLQNMEKHKTKLIVMGGTFDPPTIAHRSILRSAMDLIQADLSLIVPSNDFYDKSVWKPNYDPTERQDFQTRRKMLELTFPESRFIISGIEGESKKKMAMIETLSKIRSMYPDADIFLLLGDDNLMQFHRWKEPEKILEIADLIVVERDVDRAQIEAMIRNHQDLYQSKVRIIESDPDTRQFSSTKVRQLSSVEELYEFIVPETADFIVSHHLYQF